MSNKIKAIIRFFSNPQKNDDVRNLFYWLNSEKGNSELHNALDNEWKAFDNDTDIKVDSNKIFTEINGQIKKSNSLSLKQSIKSLLPYAAILIIAIGAIYFFYGQITFTEGTSIKSGSYTSVVAGNGHRSKVILPDNTIVWINSGTTISYNYNQKPQRHVILDGQAFFEVGHDKDRPFIVEAKQLKVEVLGTKFDVEAYAGAKNINVVLESGSVNLLNTDNGAGLGKLKPGEIAVFNSSTGDMDVAMADIQKHISWKDNLLVFKDDPMDLVIEKLERWYNIEIEVADPKIYGSIFTGKIRNESYEQVFELIEYSCQVNCQIINNYNSIELPKIIMKDKK